MPLMDLSVDWTQPREESISLKVHLIQTSQAEKKREKSKGWGAGKNRILQNHGTIKKITKTGTIRKYI